MPEPTTTATDTTNPAATAKEKPAATLKETCAGDAGVATGFGGTASPPKTKA